jgi:hypothetical protein
MPNVKCSLQLVLFALAGPILDAMHKWGTKYRMLNGKQGAGKKKEDIACEAKGDVA